VPAAETCFRFTDTAVGDVIRGVQMSNCGARTLTVNGEDSGCAPASNCTAATSFPKAADGYWYLLFSATSVANCSSTWWWSP